MTSLEALESYCNPPEAPIWMGDLSFKKLGDIKLGDEIIGYSSYNGMAGFHNLAKNCLCKSFVVGIKRKKDKIVKIKFNSGNIIRATPDHNWLVKTDKSLAWHYGLAKKGKFMARIIQPTKNRIHDLDHQAGWLAGIYDGEGWDHYISQYEHVNPDIYKEIYEVSLELGINLAESKKGTGYYITGGRQGYVNFLNIVHPIKRYGLENKIFGRTLLNPPDYIMSIDPDGEEEVICLTTTTGNYIVWGYASKNSSFHAETFDELLEWPYRRFIKAFSAWQKRRAIDEIESRKNIHVGALYSVVEWKEAGDQEKAIMNVEQYYENLKDIIWNPNKAEEENREMRELEASDSFLRAGKRNIQKMIPIQAELPGQNDIEDLLV